MSEVKETSVIGGILKKSYAAVFHENWPVWLGGGSHRDHECSDLCLGKALGGSWAAFETGRTGFFISSGFMIRRRFLPLFPPTPS